MGKRAKWFTTVGLGLAFACGMAVVNAGNEMLEVTRRGGLAGCPIYDIRIFSDGIVEYAGHAGVSITGHRAETLDESSMARLRQAFDPRQLSEIEKRQINGRRTIRKVYDCEKDRNAVAKSRRLTEECRNRSSVEVTVQVGLDGPNDELKFRSSGTTHRIRMNRLAFDDMRSLQTLLNLVDEEVNARRWTGRDPC